MKNLSKIGLITAIISLTLLVCGCDSKEYTCTKVENDDNMKTTTSALIKKEGIEVNISVVTEATSEEKAIEAEKKLNEMELYTSVNRDGKKITAEYSKFFEGKTSKSNKKELEKDGYTCK